MKILVMTVSMVLSLLFAHLIWPGPDGSALAKAAVSGGGAGMILVLLSKVLGSKTSD